MLSTLEQTPKWMTADDCAIKWLMSLAHTLCSKKIIVWAVWYGHYSGISSSAATCGRAIHFPPLLLHRELYKILAVVLKCHKICTEKLKKNLTGFLANCGYRLCSKKLKMHQKQLTDALSLIPEPLVGFQAAASRPGERRNEWWKEKEERKEELEFDSKQASWKIPLLACPYAHTCRWTDKSKT